MPTDMLQDCARLQELLASIRPSIPSQYDDDNHDGTPDANDTGTHEVPDTGSDPAPSAGTPTSPKSNPPGGSTAGKNPTPPPISVVPTQPDWNPAPDYIPHPEEQYPPEIPTGGLPDLDDLYNEAIFIQPGEETFPLDPLHDYDPTQGEINEFNLADILPFSPADRIPTPRQFSHDQMVWNETIDRNPGDDTQKLIYADWLDENGQEQQARRMRLAVQASGEARSGGHWSRDWITSSSVGQAIRDMSATPEWAQMLYGVELARATMDTVNIAPNSVQVQDGINQALEIAFRYACGVATADEVWNARSWIDQTRSNRRDEWEITYTDQYFLDGLAAILEPTRNGVIRNLPAAVANNFLSATNNAYHSSQHQNRDEQENQLRAEIVRLTDVYQRLAQTDEAEPEGYSRYGRYSHGDTSLSRMAETLQEIRYDLDYADSVPDEDTYDISDAGTDDPAPPPRSEEQTVRTAVRPPSDSGGRTKTSAPPQRSVVPTSHPTQSPSWQPLPPEFTPHPDDQYWNEDPDADEPSWDAPAPVETPGRNPAMDRPPEANSPPQSFPAEQQRWHQAIDESPFDDTPKLVYADYLDETGHEDEAFRLRWAANTSRAAAASQAPKWVAPERIFEAGRIMNDAPQWVQTLYGVDLAKQTLPLIQQSMESSLSPMQRQHVLRAMGVAQRFAVGLATPQEAEAARTAIRGLIPSGSLSRPAQAFLNALAITLIPDPQGPYQSVPVAATPLFQEAIRTTFRDRDTPVPHQVENHIRHMISGTADVYQQAMQQGSQEWEARQRRYARYADSVPEEETFSIADEGTDDPVPRESPQDRPGSTNAPKASNPAPRGANPPPHSVKPVSRPSFSPQDYPTPDWSSPPEPDESEWEQEPTEVSQDATEQHVPTSEQENWNFVFDTSGDDNTPKLVYADYLDENGQEEAAFRLRSMVSAGDQIRRVVNSGELYNGRRIGDVLGAFTQMQEQPEWKRGLYLADLAEWSVSQVLPKVFRDQAAPVISVARRVALGLATPEDQRWAAERIQEMNDDNEAVRQEHANRGDPDSYRGYDYSGALLALTTLFDFHGDGSNFRHGVWAFCNAPYRHQQGENQTFTPSRSLVTGIGNTAAVMARIYADQPSQPPTNASRYSRRSFTVTESEQEEACAYVAMRLTQLLPTLYQASGEPSMPTAGGNSEYTPSPGGTPDRDYYRQKTPYYTPPRPIQGQNPPIPYGGDAKCGQCGLKFFVAKNSVNSNCPRCGASSLQYIRYADDTRDRGPANPKPEVTKKDNDEARPKAPLGTGLLEMLIGPEVAAFAAPIDSPEFLIPEESDYAAVERPPVSYDTMMYNCYQMMDKLAGCR